MPQLTFFLILCATALGIAGTDLVLPAVPSLPATLGGDPELAQLVLAAFAAGTALGLVAFGALGAHVDARVLLPLSLIAYAFISFTATFVSSLLALTVLRFFQGAASSAAAVFAPGIIRATFPPARAMGAVGLLGSLESVVPALAPLLGAWLLAVGGWRTSFYVIAAGAVGLSALLYWRMPTLPRGGEHGSYAALLRSRAYLRYAVSHACGLGGLLTFVFGAPTVITLTMGGTLRDFVTMQVIGISAFIIGANTAALWVKRLGTERTIVFGSCLSAAALIALCVYAAAGGHDARLLPLVAVPLNLGFGWRGPPGFYQAVMAADGDDARGAALTVLAVLLTAAAGTALAAPFIMHGVLVISVIAAAITLLGLGWFLKYR